MHSTIECFECGVKQCLKIVRLINGNPDDEVRVQKHLLRLKDELNLAEPPSTYTSKMLVAVMDLLGVSDPFQRIKEEQNRRAMELVAELAEEIAKSEAPLRTALLLAAGGNVLDVGPRHNFDIKGVIKGLRGVERSNPSIPDLLLHRLKQSRRVMYILDNAGEVLFDRLVFKYLPAEVELTIVARSAPILNDVTVSEAKALGLGEYGRVIGTGSRYLGIDFNTVSEEFKRAYFAADLVIAKGHANFESLVDDGRDGFYLLTAKCELVANRSGVGLGDSVCYYSEGNKGG